MEIEDIVSPVSRRRRFRLRRQQSPSSVFSSSRPESGSLAVYGKNRWMFKQFHLRTIVLQSQVIPLIIGLYGVYRTSFVGDHFVPIDFPGLDGFLFRYDKSDSPQAPPDLKVAKWVTGLLSHYFIISGCCGLWGLQKFHQNPSSRTGYSVITYIGPSFLAMTSFIVPLVLLSIRVYISSYEEVVFVRSDFSTVLEIVLLAALPVLLFWLVYIYMIVQLFRGCSYYHKRQSRNKLPTPTSQRALLDVESSSFHRFPSTSKRKSPSKLSTSNSPLGPVDEEE